MTLFTGERRRPRDRRGRRAAAVTIWYAPETFTAGRTRDPANATSRTSTGRCSRSTNLPEVVKGALFARYSRTTKSLRRLFLDEFAEDVGGDRRADAAPARRAPSSSTSACSWSTATIPWRSSAACTSRASRRRSCCARRWSGDGWPPTWSSRRATCATTTGPAVRWRATVPPEIAGDATRGAVPRVPRHGVRRPTGGCTSRWSPGSRNGSRSRTATPTSSTGRRSWRRRATRCGCCCRPATRSNLGIYATGQSYEQLLMRLAAHPLAEMREYGELMLVGAPQGDPGVPQARRRGRTRRARGPRTGATTRERVARRRRRSASTASSPSRGRRSRSPTGTPTARLKVVGRGALRRERPPGRSAPRDRARADARAAGRGPARDASAIERTAGTSRAARGSARTTGSTCCCDYGAFRDLQRHRPLTIEWQRLTTGARLRRRPPAIDEAGLRARLGAGHGGERRDGTRAPRRRDCARPRSTPWRWRTGSGSSCR